MTQATRRRRIQRELRKGMLASLGQRVRWGRDDCAMFVADALRAAGCGDAAAPMRGRYRSRNGARRVMGVTGLLGALRNASRRLGWRGISPGAAWIGDVGLIMSPAGFTTVCKIRRGSWVARSECGYAIVPTDAVKRAWRTS